MPVVRITEVGGLNSYINPLVKDQANLIRAVNVEAYPYGAMRKRAGYDTYLGTANGSTVTNLFSWTKNDGSLFVYRESGGVLYHSPSGTTDWAVCGNGTVTAGNYIGHAVLDDTLVICDGAGSTRHTTNGTAFTDTTLAPVAVDVVEYQNRIYALGTASTLFYSTANDATNWNTSGTSDSSSFTIPDAGKLKKGMKIADQLYIGKTSGKMFKWDGYSLKDMSTDLAPTSPFSVSTQEGFFIWLTRSGLIGSGGGGFDVLDRAIKAQIYNDAGTGITGSNFDSAPAIMHRYNYFISVGDVTDDVVGETVSNCVIRYDFEKDIFSNNTYENNPTAWESFTDTSGNKRLIFGATGGQCYEIKGTETDDNGNPIEATMEFVLHLGAFEVEKEYKQFWAMFNPASTASVQFALSDTLSRGALRWQSLGNAKNGILHTYFPSGSRSRLLFIKITDASTVSRFKFYGMALDVDPIPFR